MELRGDFEGGFRGTRIIVEGVRTNGDTDKRGIVSGSAEMSATLSQANAHCVGLRKGCGKWLTRSTLAPNLYVRWDEPIGAF